MKSILFHTVTSSTGLLMWHMVHITTWLPPLLGYRSTLQNSRPHVWQQTFSGNILILLVCVYSIWHVYIFWVLVVHLYLSFYIPSLYLYMYVCFVFLFSSNLYFYQTKKVQFYIYKIYTFYACVNIIFINTLRQDVFSWAFKKNCLVVWLGKKKLQPSLQSCIGYSPVLKLLNLVSLHTLSFSQHALEDAACKSHASFLGWRTSSII